MARFVDRREEIATLEREYRREGASFVVVYGRRRVGKTTALKRFIEGKRAIYFLATEELESVNRDSFRGVVAAALGNALLASAHVDRWESIFDEIADDSAANGRIVIVPSLGFSTRIL